MNFKSLFNNLVASITATIATGAVIIPQPYSILLLVKISIGIMLIDLLVEPLMHFFVLKKYFFNHIFITFLLYFSALIFFTFIAFSGFLGNKIEHIFSLSFMWALFSSIIRNIMYYTK